jgi:4-carboxymuconolactone decarboxylase
MTTPTEVTDVADDRARALGHTTRAEILGESHVNNTRSPDPWTAKLQAVAEEFCWGDVWRREYLDRRERSLVTMALLIALNRPDELRLHVEGALRNGCQVSEILEVAVHSSVYCGLPGAVAALKTMTDQLGPDRVPGQS